MMVLRPKLRKSRIVQLLRRILRGGSVYENWQRPAPARVWLEILEDRTVPSAGHGDLPTATLAGGPQANLFQTAQAGPVQGTNTSHSNGNVPATFQQGGDSGHVSGGGFNGFSTSSGHGYPVPPSGAPLRGELAAAIQPAPVLASLTPPGESLLGTPSSLVPTLSTLNLAPPGAFALAALDGNLLGTGAAGNLLAPTIVSDVVAGPITGLTPAAPAGLGATGTAWFGFTASATVFAAPDRGGVPTLPLPTAGQPSAADAGWALPGTNTGVTPVREAEALFGATVRSMDAGVPPAGGATLLDTLYASARTVDPEGGSATLIASSEEATPTPVLSLTVPAVGQSAEEELEGAWEFHTLAFPVSFVAAYWSAGWLLDRSTRASVARVLAVPRLRKAEEV